MPYAIAHPAAAVPLHRLLGRHAVPSALVIGSLIPDAWYLVPFLTRPDTHRASGLLYCLPLGLLAYLAFHLLLKQPLLALFPARLAARLRACTCEGLPRAAWAAVLASLAAASVVHVLWDAFTHEGILSRAWPWLQAPIFEVGTHAVPLFQLLQHLSTLLGTAYVAWWVAGKLRRTPAPGAARNGWPRAPVALLLLGIPAAVFASRLLPLEAAGFLDWPQLRAAVRGAAVQALAAFGFSTLVYCVLWRLARRL